MILVFEIHLCLVVTFYLLLTCVPSLLFLSCVPVLLPRLISYTCLTSVPLELASSHCLSTCSSSPHELSLHISPVLLCLFFGPVLSVFPISSSWFFCITLVFFLCLPLCNLDCGLCLSALKLAFRSFTCIACVRLVFGSFLC